MKTHPIIISTIFCAACAGSLFYFAANTGRPIGKILDRVDTSLPRAVLARKPDPSGKPRTTTLYKTNYPMPEELRQALARLWIEKARKEREALLDPEIADIVENQIIEPCITPGLMRMEDGRCWLPETWRKLHPETD